MYSIVDHGRHTHLAYELGIPKEPGDVQKQFCILKEGNYIINIKVPYTNIISAIIKELVASGQHFGC